ncbi:MAG TPA: sigma-54 dependent transcriptional regulator [Terriglobia bacterium]|nr:sigma-54 dependent transcriptional regulator [Terriglobia bacterium]
MQQLIHKEQGSILIATASEEFRCRIEAAADAAGYAVAERSGGAGVLAALEEEDCQGVAMDSWLPDLEASEVVQMIRAVHPEVEIVLRDIETGELSAPFHRPGSAWLQGLLAESSPPPGCGQEKHSAAALPRGDSCETLCAAVPSLPGMIGRSAAMLRIYRLVRLVSPRATTVLVTGESGTGKELVASAIHALSPRAGRPFVVVNCAAIPETLLEAELFGHSKGAFSGAAHARIGRIQAASGGTLFLDEIGELPPAMQPKLLRFLQSGEIQRLGANETIRVDVRVVAATNAKLAERVAQGSFREDLYYRLAVFPIELEPLRERPEDILPLAGHFLDSLCREAGMPPKRLAPDAGRFLEQYPWPGNVRELRQAIERAFILSEQEPVVGLPHLWFPSPGSLKIS